MIPPRLPLQVGAPHSAKPWRLGVKKAVVADMRLSRRMSCCGVPQTRQSREVSMCPATVHVRYAESTSLDDVPFWQSTQGGTNRDSCCYHNWDGK